MPSAEKCAHAQSRQVSFHLNQIGRKNHVCSDFAQTEVNKELLIKPPCLVCLVFFQWNEWRRRRKQAHVKVTCTSFVSFPLSCKGSLSAASEFTENLLKFVSSVVNGCEQPCGVKALHFFFSEEVKYFRQKMTSQENNVCTRFSDEGCNVVFFSSERVTNVVSQTLFRLTGERQEVVLIHDPLVDSCCELLSV